MSEATQRAHLDKESDSNQVIVQCPGCQTKFLVGAASFKGVDFPRFHCSRCDNLFSLDADALGAQASPASTVTAASPTQNELFAPFDPTEEETHTVEIAPERVAVAAPPTPTIDDFAPISESELAALKVEPPPSSPPTSRIGSTRGIEMPRSSEGRGRVAPPIESRSEQARRDQITFDFIASSIPSDRLFEADRSFERDVKGVSMVPAHTPVRRTTGWRGVATFAFPILGCLAILGVAAFSIGSHRSLDENVLKTLLPNAPEVASSEIRVIDTAFERIPLSNGETVHLITGTVVNDSSSDVSNVVLEGLTFDAAGKTLTSAKVTSGATLAHSRLQSLTPDIIVKLQSGENSRPLRLRAGDSERVSLALTDAAAQDARFFSARVFSVRKATD